MSGIDYNLTSRTGQSATNFIPRVGQGTIGMYENTSGTPYSLQSNTGYGENALFKNGDIGTSLGSGLASMAGSKTSELSGLDKLFGTDSGRAMVDTGLGIGQLGLGLASYLSNAKMLKKQGALMDQQLANNAKEMARRDSALSAFDKGVNDYRNKNGAVVA